MTLNSRQSHVVLSKLSAGSSYMISVTSTQGRAQSDALTSVITTGRHTYCSALPLVVLM